MVTREQQRADTVPELARLMRSRDFITLLRSLSRDSAKVTIITALPDDRMGYVLDRLREGGGVGVVALRRGQTDWRVAVMAPASHERIAVAQEDDSLAEVHGDSRVDMFFECLSHTSVMVVQRVAARLVSDWEPVS